MIPALESVTGKPYNPARLAELGTRSARAEVFIQCMEAPPTGPARLTAISVACTTSRRSSSFRGTEQAIAYYEKPQGNLGARCGRLGPITGRHTGQENTAWWWRAPELDILPPILKLFYDHGAVPVASTYTRVGGLYDHGFRHDPVKPLESLARYCMGCYTNLNLPQRVDLLTEYVQLSGGRTDRKLHQVVQLLLAGRCSSCRKWRSTGVPVGFSESDLVDPRYFSYA